MTKGEHWTDEQIEKEVERKLGTRNWVIGTVNDTTPQERKEYVYGHSKPHLTEDEYRDYIREIIKQEPLPPKYQDKYSAKEKTQIKKDWQQQFPEMGYSSKGMSLGKLVGPLFIGISLALGSKWEVACYRPESATHSFTYKEDVMIKGVGWDAMPPVIYPHDHETQHIKAANYLKQKCSILEGALTLDKIFKAYSIKNYSNLNYTTAGTPATIAAWAGDVAKAKEYLEWGYDNMSKKYGENKKVDVAKYIAPYDILGRNLPLDKPFKELWLRYHQDMIDNPEILRQIARNEIQRREWLRFAPYYDIKDAPYQEGNIWEPLEKNKPKKN